MRRPDQLLGALVYGVIHLVILFKVSRATGQNMYVDVGNGLACTRAVLHTHKALLASVLLKAKRGH